MKDETGDKAPERTMPGQRKYIDPLKEATAHAAQLWKKAAEVDWTAPANCGLDINEALEHIFAVAEKEIEDLVVMATRQPPKGMERITPEGLMERSIEDVTTLAGNSVCRIRKWMRMGAPKSDRVIRWWCRREGHMAYSYWVVLILRARELVALCERLRIRGCTETFARRHPFLVAQAVKHRLHGDIDDED